MTGILHDAKIGWRTALRNPGFAVPAVAALTVGIGSCVAMFSVVYAVFLKPLPYRDPSRIVTFILTTPTGSGPQASPTKFSLWREQTTVFDRVSAFRRNSGTITDGDVAEQVTVGRVSADCFPLFGASFAEGRAFTADEDRPNGGHVVILSHGFWRRRFGSDIRIVGRSVILDGLPHVVVGIIGTAFESEEFNPSGKSSPLGHPDVWVPLQLDPASHDHANYFVAAARLKPGISLAMARGQLKVAADDYRRRFPEVAGPNDGFTIEPLIQVMTGEAQRSVVLLMIGVGFVLVIAYANVANLLIIRATVRKPEIAVRRALGAGDWQIARLLLMESGLVAAMSTIGGLALGATLIRVLLSINPEHVPRISRDGFGVLPDWPVVLFAAGLALATIIVFGFVPMIRSSGDVVRPLKIVARSSGGGARYTRIRAAAVVCESALTLVLLVGASLLIRTSIALRSIDPGFDSSNVLTMRTSLASSRFVTTSAVTRVVHDGVARVRALAGVEVVGATCCVPLENNLSLPFIVAGRPLSGAAHGSGVWITVSSDYFRAFRIPLIQGRTFSLHDDGSASEVAIVNQAMARRFWPTGDPLNDRITIGKGLGPQFVDAARQIVGVVGDVRGTDLGREPEPTMYVPLEQLPDGMNALNNRVMSLAWIVRAMHEPRSLSAAIKTELEHASGGVPVTRIRTMSEVTARSTAHADFPMLILTVFGSASLLLAAIGIYGVMAYTVRQRGREIGIRRALGASSAQVQTMVVLHGVGLWLLGIAVGTAAAFALTRLIANMLFGVSARDPVVLLGVPLFMIAVAVVSVWLPARFASQLDPAVALRDE